MNAAPFNKRRTPINSSILFHFFLRNECWIDWELNWGELIDKWRKQQLKFISWICGACSATQKETSPRQRKQPWNGGAQPNPFHWFVARLRNTENKKINYWRKVNGDWIMKQLIKVNEGREVWLEFGGGKTYNPLPVNSINFVDWLKGRQTHQSNFIPSFTKPK